MPDDRGRNHRVSLPRRWIGDMLHFAQRVPMAGVERIMRIKPLIQARRAVRHPPTWHALMTKALGITSMRQPCLRWCMMPWPWPHFYEAPHSVASVVFERDFRGELATFLCPLLHPERLPLAQIHAKIQAWKTDPIERHGVLRRVVRNAKPPLLVRRALWWSGLNVSGYLRARTFGTFAINTVAGLRGKMLSVPTPLTTVWYYGVPDSNRGEVTMQLFVDHRVLDGFHVKRICDELENVLNNEMVNETRAGAVDPDTDTGTAMSSEVT
jgi:hypothetical protein